MNYATEKATVDYDPAAVEPEALVGAVEAAGYHAVLPADEPDTEPPADESPALRFRLILSAVLSLPVLLVSMIPALQFDNWQWLALNFATPVVLWGAWPFHRAAWANLRHGTGDDGHADQPRHARRLAVVALRAHLRRRRHGRHADELRPDPRAGEGANHIYLETAAVVTTFILAGRYFEAARQAPRRRRAEGAARARRQGRHARRRPHRRRSST